MKEQWRHSTAVYYKRYFQKMLCWNKFINLHKALTPIPESMPRIIRNAIVFCTSKCTQRISVSDQGTASLPLSPNSECYLLFSNMNYWLVDFRARILVSTFSWEMIIQFPKHLLVWAGIQGKKNKHFATACFKLTLWAVNPWNKIQHKLKPNQFTYPSCLNTSLPFPLL